MKERLAQTFIGLINISEVHPHEKKIIEYIEGFLKDIEVERERDDYGNVIARIPGKGESVMVNTHMDVPEANPHVNPIREGDIVRSDGTSILGADPKSGLAVILEFLRNIAGTDQKAHKPVEVVFTRGEEAGLKGAINLDYSLLESQTGLVLDEDGPVTQVIIQAPAFVIMDAKCEGKAVHPREPEKGINALQVASEAISQIPWGYSHSEVSWNIGTLRAGTARNTVPGEVELQAELRSYKTELTRSEADRIEDIFGQTAERFGAECRVDKQLIFGGYKLEKTHSLFEKLEQTYKSMDLKPNYFATFGGSDANVFNDNGIVSVPIGSGYHNAHQYSEYIDLGEMEQLEKFLERFYSN